MFERFTEKSIKVIMLAQEEARRLGHNFVGTEMLLLGIIGCRDKVASETLKDKGADLKNTRIEVEKIVGRGDGFVSVEIPFTPRSKQALRYSWDEAKQQGCNYINPEHLLLGLIQEGEGVAIRVLENLGIDVSGLKPAILETQGVNLKTSKSKIIDSVREQLASITEALGKLDNLD